MTRQPWDDVFDRVRVQKLPNRVYPFRPIAAELDLAEAALGCRLPASYRAFAERFGLWGELDEFGARLCPLSAEQCEYFNVISNTRYWRDAYSGIKQSSATLPTQTLPPS
jgi:hypothetical protein